MHTMHVVGSVRVLSTRRGVAGWHVHCQVVISCAHSPTVGFSLLGRAATLSEWPVVGNFCTLFRHFVTTGRPVSEMVWRAGSVGVDIRMVWRAMYNVAVCRAVVVGVVGWVAIVVV